MAHECLQVHLETLPPGFGEPEWSHPNEAVNESLQSIFIAIPKSGSTTIRRQIAPDGVSMIKGYHLSIQQIYAVMKTFELYRSLGQNRVFPNPSHLSQEAVFDAANEKFEKYFKFTCVRNPWARAVSVYFREQGVQVSDKIDFRAFCENYKFSSETSIWPTRFKNQLDWLTDESGNNRMDYCIKVEELETALSEIRDLTSGRINLENLLLNKSKKSEGIDYRDMYDSQTMGLIAREFEQDIETFKYTF